MAIYRKVMVRMWGDEKVMALSRPQPCGQALWIHLLTGEQTDIIPGLCRIGEAAFAEQLGWPLEGFRDAFREVNALGMAKADWNARVVWVPKAIEHNAPTSVNVVKSWADAWDRIPECSLKVEAWQTLKAFLDGMAEGFREAFATACPKPRLIQEQEQEQEQEAAAAAATVPAEAPSGGLTSREASGAVVGQGEVQGPTPPARVNPTAPEPEVRPLAVVDEAETSVVVPPTPTEVFRRRLADRLARTMLHPVGGGGSVLTSVEASLRVVPLDEAVELCAQRAIAAATSGKRQPGTLLYFAQVLADEAVGRTVRAPAERRRRAVGVDEQGQPIFEESAP